MNSQAAGLLLQVAIEYAAAYQMSKEETAAVLADAFLKGLLAAHHDVRAESSVGWDAAAFVTSTEVGHSPQALAQGLWMPEEMAIPSSSNPPWGDLHLRGVLQSIAWCCL